MLDRELSMIQRNRRAKTDHLQHPVKVRRSFFTLQAVKESKCGHSTKTSPKDLRSVQIFDTPK